MASSWTDLDRPPLSAARLQRSLGGGPVWRDVRVVPSTASTNADLVAAARAGEPEGLVLVAEVQSGGRGRLGRAWESPPRAGLLMSMLLRPAVPTSAFPLVPLLTGTAIVEALRSVASVDAVLKWPNDVLVRERKLGGVLVERVDGAVVVGVGLNISTTAAELPGDTATSVAVERGVTDREPIAKEVLRAFARRYQAFCAAEGAASAVLPAYRDVCDSIGRRVSIHLPGGATATGVVTDVDDRGMLVVCDGAGVAHAWSAGDVVHVRDER